MEDFQALSAGYLFKVKERGRKSKVYKSYQLTGLRLAEFLEDDGHKSLYIKLAKEYPAEKLLGLAKRIADNHNIKNKGAYFMSVFFDKKDVANINNQQ